MKYIILFLLVINSYLSKADGIYYLRDSIGIEDIKKIDSLNIVVLDSISFDYAISDSIRNYKIYAKVPLYDLVDGEIRVVSKGFDVKFNSIKELMIFLFNTFEIKIEINKNTTHEQPSKSSHKG